MLLKSDEILNFPRIIELEGDCLVLPYGCGRHDGAEIRPVAISDDFEVTWADLPSDSPMADLDGNSNSMSHFVCNQTEKKEEMEGREECFSFPSFHLFPFFGKKLNF